MLWDTHLHTNFSGDSDALPEDMVQAAINANLSGICFTDHEDFDYLDLENPQDPDSFLVDFSRYFPTLENLSEKYREILPIHIGIELGLQPHLADTLSQLTAAHPFDFVIASSHMVHGMDPYYPQFYENKIQDEAYMEYFSSILENLAAFSDFDVYGHLDYVVRYGPTKNADYSYEKFRDILDEILKTLIAKGKGLEINTGGFRSGLGHPNPTEDILKRYRELGGEIITLGSDAHAPKDVAFAFSKVPALLQECGFSYYTVFKNRTPKFLPL